MLVQHQGIDGWSSFFYFYVTCLLEQIPIRLYHERALNGVRLTVISCKGRLCRIVTALSCCHWIQPATESKRRPNPKLVRLTGIRKHVRSAGLLASSLDEMRQLWQGKLFVLSEIQEMANYDGTMGIIHSQQHACLYFKHW